MVSNKTITVIRHLAFEDLGSFESILMARGYRINYIEAADLVYKPDDISQAETLSDGLLVILGGPISVNDGDMFPFIDSELSLLKQRIAADLPTLGICLGAQLIARALGSEVYPGEKEIGWYDLTITPDGGDSALRYLCADHCTMLHWHGETFDLPTGAVLLASSDKCTNQAFRYGDNVLALQFHPEVTQHAMEKWFIGHIGEISQTAGVSVEHLREDTRRYANQLEMQGELFFNSWLNEVTKF